MVVGRVVDVYLLDLKSFFDYFPELFATYEKVFQENTILYCIFSCVAYDFPYCDQFS